jgi:hypothetical protein
MPFDASPRRVWLGTTIPGKKMMAMISSAQGIERGSELIDLYKGDVHRAMWAAACALHDLPEKGAVGPAFRDVTKPLVPGAVYGAMLTDIRDFLKFRFRATGLSAADIPSDESLLEDLVGGQFPEGVEPRHLIRVVNFAISVLDALSRDRQGKTDFMAARRQLRNLLLETTKTWDPSRHEATDTIMDEMAESS